MRMHNYGILLPYNIYIKEKIDQRFRKKVDKKMIKNDKNNWKITKMNTQTIC